MTHREDRGGRRENSEFYRRKKFTRAYEEAIAKKYLWHEFGDLNLIL